MASLNLSIAVQPFASAGAEVIDHDIPRGSTMTYRRRVVQPAVRVVDTVVYLAGRECAQLRSSAQPVAAPLQTEPQARHQAPTGARAPST